MRILEVRDGFIKIETTKKVSISSFLQICDAEKKYIAQIVQTKTTENSYLVLAKILFLYDGTLKNYDKSIPNKESQIEEFTFDIINKTLNYNIPIIAGKFIDNSIDIEIDKSCFNKKMLISVDSEAANNRIVANLSKQFSALGKIVVIDMLGVLYGHKYVAGVDFKLPLNTDSLNFMYEDCLNDATAESKSLIKEIFDDLSEYSKTVPFLPFGTLKAIVDDMVDKQHIFKLLVLKNKLSKFAQQGYFALTSEEAHNLNKIINEDIVVIDLSKLDTTFQNRYLDTIYSLLDDKTQVFLEASNNLNKKNIKNILTNESVSTTFITHSKFKYINEIKSMFDNFIIEPSFSNNETFKVYSAFLNSMPKNTYLLVGEGTNYIPFVSSLEAVINIPQIKKEETKISTESNEITDDSSDFEEIVDDKISESTTDKDIVEEDNDFELTEDEEIEETEIEEEVSTQITDIEAEEIIEQKADELINKISEEISDIEPNNAESLFEEDNEEDNENLSGLEDINEETIEAESQEESVEEQVNIIDEGEILIEDSHLEYENINATTEELEEKLVEESLDPTPEIQIEDLEEKTFEKTVKSFENENEFHTETDEIQTIEIPEDISDLTEEIELEATEEIEEIELLEGTEILEEQGEIEETTILTEDNDDIDSDSIKLKDYSDYEENIDDTDIKTTTINEDEASFDEIVELDVSEIGDDTILVDFEEDGEIQTLSEDDLDKQIVEDVDKVFTTIKEDTISDSDLDFIDELNSENSSDELEEVSLDGSIEELPENFDDEQNDEEFLQPIEEHEELTLDDDIDDDILETKNTKTPIVPVYDAEIPQEDIVMSDPIEQGDVVVHAKYGTGTVEKMIKYGTKTLFSINFDNIGRRLLDPTLTEIKKA